MILCKKIIRKIKIIFVNLQIYDDKKVDILCLRKKREQQKVKNIKLFGRKEKNTYFLIIYSSVKQVN